ncbi:MAG: AAA family ATPase [Chloroflexi bacterium]|nr:AAA family ATPase [Chloroflexota bacterium]
MRRPTGFVLDLLEPTGEFSPAELVRPTNPFAQVEALKTSMRAIRTRMIGRDRLLEQTLLAFLTRRNQLIFSPPGTGKTLYSQLVFNQLKDAEVFAIQLTAGTPEEALVGAIDLERFQKGVVWHDVNGSLVTADFAFLDELMDANDLVLRAILGILNEKMFSKGKQSVRAKLHTAIAATNFLRRTQMSQAVLDRFIFKAYLAPDASPLDQLRTDEVYGRFGNRPGNFNVTLDVGLLTALSNVVRSEGEGQIFAPASVLFLKNKLIKEYTRRVNLRRAEQNANADELYVSPRTIAECRDILNASALLAHRMDVRMEDLSTLCYVLPVVYVGGPTETTSLPGRIRREDEMFFETLDSVSAMYSQNDLRSLEEIMELSSYYDAFRSGKLVETAREGGVVDFFRRGLRLIGLLSWEDATNETFTRTLRNMTIAHRDVDEIREALITRITGNG